MLSLRALGRAAGRAPALRRRARELVDLRRAVDRGPPVRGQQRRRRHPEPRLGRAPRVWTRSGWLGLESVSIGGDYPALQRQLRRGRLQHDLPGRELRPRRADDPLGRRPVAERRLRAGDRRADRAGARGAERARGPLEQRNGQSVDATAGTTRYPDSSARRSRRASGCAGRCSAASRSTARSTRPSARRTSRSCIASRSAATQITLPNPYLKAETATGREVGLSTGSRRPGCSFKGTWYVADYNDFNVPVTLSA